MGGEREKYCVDRYSGGSVDLWILVGLLYLFYVI